MRVQKALGTLASFGDNHIRDAALHHGQLALKRVSLAMQIAEDLNRVEDAAGFIAESEEALIQQNSAVSMITI